MNINVNTPSANGAALKCCPFLPAATLPQMNPLNAQQMIGLEVFPIACLRSSCMLYDEATRSCRAGALPVTPLKVH